MENVQKALGEVEKQFKELCDGSPCSFEDGGELDKKPKECDVKETWGVYMVYENNELNKPIYIGMSGNIRKRLKTDLKRTGVHVLHNKLHYEAFVELYGKPPNKNWAGTGDSRKKVNDFIKSCEFRFLQTKDENETKLLEALAIRVFNPDYNNQKWKEKTNAQN